jgi:hypothetical protein
MTIHIAKNAPSGSREALGRYFSEGTAPSFLRGGNLSTLSASDAYPVYIASLQDLLAGRLPPRPHVWRHLLFQADGPVAEADVTHAEQTPRVVAMHRGPRAAATARALEATAEIHEKDYELRMLESPAIHLVAVWLHADTGGVMIPIEPDQSGLDRDQAIPMDDALPRLRDLATAVQQAVSASPEGSGS